jgi:hypothetical protein
MASILKLIPDRKQAAAALLLVLASIFALLPAFHHHQVVNLATGEAVAASVAPGVEIALSGTPPALSAAQVVDVDCKLCALGNQTPLWGPKAPLSASPGGLFAVPAARHLDMAHDAPAAARPRAPPHLA